MATIVDAIYSTLANDPVFNGRVYRDRPPGPNGLNGLPYAIIRGDVELERRIDMDGRASRRVRRIDIVDADGHSSEIVEEMAEACASLFDEDPGLNITGYDVLAVSSQGPADLPPDQETYGRSVLVTLWLEREE